MVMVKGVLLTGLLFGVKALIEGGENPKPARGPRVALRFPFPQATPKATSRIRLMKRITVSWVLRVDAGSQARVATRVLRRYARSVKATKHSPTLVP